MVVAVDGNADRAGRHDPQLVCVDSHQIPHLHSCFRAFAAGFSLYTSNMNSGVSVDEFQALEQKVLRAVEIVKREREARATAEAEVAALREQLAAQSGASQSQLSEAQSRAQAAESQVAALNQDRDAVKLRVEKMLQQMDELV